MLLLALPYGFPAADGIGGGVAAVARVPQDAAQHARIGGGNAVVAVQIAAVSFSHLTRPPNREG